MPENSRPALLETHLHLLEGLGWWGEAERALKSRWTAILSAATYTRRLEHIQEKKRIYHHVDAPADGISYVGDDDLVQLVKGPVCIHYHLRDRDLDVAAVYRALRRAMALAEERLGFKCEEVFVNLHGPSSEIRVDGERAGWETRAGVFDGALRLKAASLKGCEPQQIDLLIAHEYLHLAVYRLTRGQCPAWLDEGLALYLTQNLPQAYDELLARALAEGGTFPLQAMNSQELFASDQESKKKRPVPLHEKITEGDACSGWFEAGKTNPGFDPEEALLSRDLLRQINRCLKRLPTHCRRVVPLYFEYRLGVIASWQQLSEIIGGSVGTISSQISRCLKKMAHSPELTEYIKEKST